MSMIGLADCNSFYASCEQAFNPKLEHRPVIVLSNNDGCVVARSALAKPIIEMGSPVFQIQEEIKKYGVAVFSSNYPLYADMSRRVMNIFKRFVMEVDIYSIDEAFLNFKGYNNLQDQSQSIRETIMKWTAIPVTIGIADTKVLAKVANRLAKKQGKEVFILKNEAEIQEILKETAVPDIWGIGYQYTKFLLKNNIKTAWEFRDCKDNWVKKYLTIVGLRLLKELRGEPCIPLEEIFEPKKNIRVSRTFAQAINNFDDLKEKVASFAARVAEKLRLQKSCANLIDVFLKTDRFKNNEPQYSNSLTLRFQVGTNYSAEIIAYSIDALKKIYTPEYKYRKAGVMVSGIVPENEIQLHLFISQNPVERMKKAKLMATMDKLNQKLGRDKVKPAIISGSGLKSKQTRLSPKYTTSWNEILRV